MKINTLKTARCIGAIVMGTTLNINRSHVRRHMCMDVHTYRLNERCERECFGN